MPSNHRVYLTEFIAGMSWTPYNPPNPTLQSSFTLQTKQKSFGARLMDSALEEDLDKAMKISAKEYVLDYANEDTEFDMALEYSKAALKEEELDEGVNERRRQALKAQEDAIVRLNELVKK